ncbi:MAG: extracellular solute-binding protein [Armatimonadota bacterium]|nr:extracellular solute-binding protein [Armatimonadota bacterium]
MRWGIVAACALVLAGAFPGAAGPVVLRVLDEGPAGNPWYQAAVAYARARAGEVQVEWVPASRAATRARLAAAVAGGALDADLVRVTGAWVAEFPTLFASVADRWPPAARARMLPAARAPVTAGGQPYGLPRRFTLWVLLWNVRLFAEAGLDPLQPPRTVAELGAACRRLTRDRDGDGYIDQWGYVESLAPGAPLFTAFERWLYRAGGAIVDARGEPAFNDARGVRALEAMAALLSEHRCLDPGALALSPTGARQLFLAGRAAMMAATTSVWVDAVGARRGGALGGQVGIAVLPGFGPGTPRTATVYEADGYALTTRAVWRGVDDAAWDLLDHLASDPVQVVALKTRGYLPTAARLYDDRELRADAVVGPLLATAGEALRHPVRRFVGARRESVEAAVSAALVEGLRGRRSLRGALDDAAAAFRALRP